MTTARFAPLVLLSLSAASALAQNAFVDDFSGSALNPRWTFADVGPDPGSATVANGILTFDAGGADIWDPADQFSYLHIKATGDFVATLKVLTVPDTSPNSRAGIMVRKDLSETSPHTYVLVEPGRGTFMEWRDAQDGNSNWTANVAAPVPVWFRVIRRGARVSAVRSLDEGRSWQANVGQTGSSHDNPGLADPEVLVGIAVTSHAAGTIGTATLDDFTFAPIGTDSNDKTPPPAISDLAATTSASGEIELTWTAPNADGDVLEYEYRYAAAPITEANWDSAKTGVGPIPGAAGAKESTVIGGFGSLEEVFLAVRATDRNGNRSAISNVARVVTPAGGDGLKAEYFTWDRELGAAPPREEVFQTANLKSTRIDPVIDYTQTTGLPLPVGVPNEGFAVRWTGQIAIPVTEEITFEAAGDDGIALWVSDKPIDPANPGEPIIDSAAWNDQGDTAYPALEPISGKAGTKLYVMQEIYQNGGGWAGHLRWSSPSINKQVIPQSYLYSTDRPLGRLRGVVTDARGGPVVNAPIVMKNSLGTFSVTADAAGAYSVVAPEGDVELTAGFTETWQNITTSQKGAIKSGEITTLDLPFDVTAPPYIIGKPDAAMSDAFAGTTLDARWTSVDIGDTEEGSTSVGGGILTVVANGADIWDPADAFRYTYQKISGDFVATLKVLSVSGVGDYERPGLMIRADDSPGSANIYLAIEPVRGTMVTWRSVTDGPSSWSSSVTTPYPVMFRVLRQGADFTVWKSTDDGATWTSNVGPGTNHFVVSGLSSPEVLVGIGYTSHVAGTLGTATFGPFAISKDPSDILPSKVSGSMPGDLNNDTRINVQDATISLRIAVGLLTPTAEQTTAGDVNKDGRLNIQDTTLILQVAVGNRQPGDLK